MKKILSLALCSALCLTLGVPALASGAVLSFQNVKVDGETVNPEVYNIDDTNYFKLRSLALLLSGTGSQFDVDYDLDTKTVTVTTGAAYTPAGGELASGADSSASAVLTSQTIQIDGETVEGLTVYNIGGSNFFKLPDLAELLGFDVDYDADTATVLVTSRTAEEAEAPAGDEAAEAEAPAEDETDETEAPAGAKAIYALSRQTMTVDGEESDVVEYSNFDAQGNPGKRVDTIGEQSFVNTMTYEYDEDGNMTRRVRVNPTDGEGVTVYEYDEAGNLVREVYTEEDLTIEDSFEYDDNGFKVKSATKINDNAPSVTVYENNEQGNPVKGVVTYGDEETASVTYTYEYDDEGRLTRRETVSSNDASTTTYEYDDAGNLVKETTVSGGSEFVTLYEYTTINAGVRG